MIDPSQSSDTFHHLAPWPETFGAGWEIPPKLVAEFGSRRAHSSPRHPYLLLVTLTDPKNHL